MNDPINFAGPFLKTERAEQHINELEIIFEAVRRANEDTLIAKDNVHRAEDTRPIGAVFARHTPTVLGDALHNLRAALDHAYCILVEANGHTVGDRINFPIHANGTRDSLNGSINGHIAAGHGPSEAIRDFIVDEIQPYSGGKGTMVANLHNLDIADKHMILLPIAQAMNVTNLEFDNGAVISGIQFISNGMPAISVAAGASVMHDKSQATFDVLFGKGQPFEFRPILPILKDMLVHVSGILRELQKRA